LSQKVPAVFLQAAAPTGLNALMTSHVYGLDSGYTPTVVVWSTPPVSGDLALLACGLT
jgi:hypothetical protein